MNEHFYINKHTSHTYILHIQYTYIAYKYACGILKQIYVHCTEYIYTFYYRHQVIQYTYVPITLNIHVCTLYVHAYENQYILYIHTYMYL